MHADSWWTLAVSISHFPQSPNSTPHPAMFTDHMGQCWNVLTPQQKEAVCQVVADHCHLVATEWLQGLVGWVQRADKQEELFKMVPDASHHHFTSVLTIARWGCHQHSCFTDGEVIAQRASVISNLPKDIELVAQLTNNGGRFLSHQSIVLSTVPLFCTNSGDFKF